MGVLVLFTYVLAVLWTWRIVFPHEFRTVKMKWQVLLCFIPIVLPMIMGGVNAPISVDDQFNGNASGAFKTWRADLIIINAYLMSGSDEQRLPFIHNNY